MVLVRRQFMMRTLTAIVVVLALFGLVCAAQTAPAAQKAPAVAAQKAPAAAKKPAAAPKSLDLKTLPPEVQKGIQAETKGAQIKNISKETENGKTQYEVETTLNGKNRDLIIDTTGKAVEIEEQTTLEAIPAPAKAAIEKKAAGGKIGVVETLTRNGVTNYEAAFTSKAGKKGAIVVKADGTVTK
jgi:hypothetical protein